MGCISSKALGRKGDEWRGKRRNPESSNNARVEEYQREQVGKSFSTLSKRPSSSKEPEGWTDHMTCFVEESDPDSETLGSFIERFEDRFPRMRNRVGRGWFECVRGDLQVVPSNNDELW